MRRLVWNIIQKQRSGRTVILTTHSMEEAEVLCQRIAIMAKGTLRCIGPQVRLKNLYGSGFRISFSCTPGDRERAMGYVEKLLPVGYNLLPSFATSISYEFPKADNIIASLFAELGQNSKSNGIIDWGISQTSLEEVFVHVIGNTDAEAD